MPSAFFLRLLDTPIPEKGTRLRAQIADLNAVRPSAGAFLADPTVFSTIPSSPFAYWISIKIRKLFSELAPFENLSRIVKQGLATADDFRFVRAWWEIAPNNLVTGNANTTIDEFRQQTWSGKKWSWFAKGGTYLPFYGDIHLVVYWEDNGKAIREFDRAVIRNEGRIFHAGLTYIARTNKTFCPRILPKGCIYGHVSPAIFIDDNRKLPAYLSVFSSSVIEYLLMISMSRGVVNTAATKAYEVGQVSVLPFPQLDLLDEQRLTQLSSHAFEIARQSISNNETSIVFSLPALINARGESLAQRLQSIAQGKSEHQDALASLQTQIDARVAELYGIPEQAINNQKMSVGSEPSEPVEGAEFIAEDNDEEGESAPSLSTPYSLVADLLMWCIGVAFARWDVRYALHPETLPPLPEPFDPLPVCSPGMLQGDDGLPLLQPPASYPLFTAPHGFLVDDPDRPADDIVVSVQRVLHLLWNANAETIENESCQILGMSDLRTWFRDPKGFFAWHIKRYSKSRRKAPIYWLLQSAKKNYAIWLYYPRLNHDSLYFAAREYADAKLNLENTRLNDLQNAVNSLSGAGRKVQERTLAAQVALVEEIKAYLKTLDAIALLDLQPDLNDGVLLNIAPLHELVPWKEAGRVWDELLAGKYTWSHIAARLRINGILRGS